MTCKGGDFGADERDSIPYRSTFVKGENWIQCAPFTKDYIGLVDPICPLNNLPLPGARKAAITKP